MKYYKFQDSLNEVIWLVIANNKREAISKILKKDAIFSGGDIIPLQSQHLNLIEEGVNENIFMLCS